MHLKGKEIIFLVLLSLVYAAVTTGLWQIWGAPSLPASLSLSFAVCAALVLETHGRIRSQVGSVHQDLDHAYRQLEALLSLTNCLSFETPLPRMQGWTITPEFANVLISLIHERKPRRIVEAGSGVSTLVSAYGLRRYCGTGTVVSLDHEKCYAEATQAAVRRHGLQDFATVVYAPLQPVSVAGKSWTWYDPACLKDLDPIDMLVIDGPPANLAEDARYPALPLFLSRLAPNAVVVLDDCIRPGEQEIVARWLKEFGGFTREYLDTQKGTIVLRRESVK